jgi:hypothetical protein
MKKIFTGLAALGLLLLAACAAPGEGEEPSVRVPELTLANTACFASTALGIVQSGVPGWGSMTPVQKGQFAIARVNEVADLCGIDVVSDEVESSVVTAFQTLALGEVDGG